MSSSTPLAVMFLVYLFNEVQCVMDVVGNLPTRGLCILVSTLATPPVTDPLLDTIGLRGCPGPGS